MAAARGSPAARSGSQRRCAPHTCPRQRRGRASCSRRLEGLAVCIGSACAPAAPRRGGMRGRRWHSRGVRGLLRGRSEPDKEGLLATTPTRRPSSSPFTAPPAHSLWYFLLRRNSRAAFCFRRSSKMSRSRNVAPSGTGGVALGGWSYPKRNCPPRRPPPPPTDDATGLRAVEALMP